MPFKYSKRSLNNLNGVHPDLQRVAHRAIEITAVDYVITDGLRTEAEQRQHVASGASTTMNSRHLTDHAIDVAAWVNGGVSWKTEHYIKIADAFKQAAKELNIPIVWGGDWRTFKDRAHFELDRNTYK